VLVMGKHKSLWSFLWNGAAWAFLFRVLFSFFGFVSGVLLTKLLPVADVGSYFLLISAVSIVSAVALFGLNLSLVPLVVDAVREGGKGRVLGVAIDSFLLVVIFSIVVSGVFLFVYYERVLLFFGGHGVWFVFLLWGMVVCGSLMNAVVEIYRGLRDIFLASFFAFFPGFFFVLFLLAYWFFLGSGDLVSVIKLSILSVLVSCLISWVVLFRVLRGGVWDTQVVRILKISAPLWVTNLMLVLLMQFDVWVLGWQGESSVVGVYGAASRLTQFLTFPLVVVNSVVVPIIGEMYLKGELTRLERLLRITSLLAFVPALLCFLFFVFMGHWLLGIVYGVEYVGGYSVLILLALGNLVSIACGSAAYMLIMAGKQKIFMSVTLFAGLVAIVLSLILVGEYGAFGVASAAATGLALQCLLMWGAVRKVCGVWTHPLWDFLMHPHKFKTYLQ
jgi:O-antigen/teichoic acid export membrane protein